jgi:ATP-binding cassette subfamily B protein
VSTATVSPAAALPQHDAAQVSNWTLVRRMLALSWQYRWGCVRLLVLQGLLLFTAVGALSLTGLGIDVVRFHAGVLSDSPPYPFGWRLPADWSPMREVIAIALTVLGLSALRGWLNYVYAVAAAELVHQRIVVDLRARVYDKLQRLSFRFFDANATGSIINRVTSDVQAVRAFVDGVLIQFVILLLSLVCYVVYMVRIDPVLTALCLATTPVLCVLTMLFSRQTRPEYDRNRELVDQMVLVLAENLVGVQVVKGFGREPEEIAKFQAASRAVRDQQRKIFWRVSLFTPFIGLLTQVNLVVLLAYGGWLVTQDRLALGTGLVVFAGLVQQFSSQVANMTNIANSVQQSLSGARRVFEVLDTPVEIESPTVGVPPSVRGVRGSRAILPETDAREPRTPHFQPAQAGTPAIEFRGVTFGYAPDELVLRDVSLRIEPGQRVAILGATGAGKSTLLSLIPRFYDTSAGQVLIDGVDVRDRQLDDLRRSIGVVFQESFLFSNTIAANIAFGQPGASREQIERAARIAAAHEFIVNLPLGYDTVLGEAGKDLSGGQRQRLAIARAVLLDPAILLLDDPAASIDPHTEHEILSAMRQAMHGRTTLIVAHRLSTLRQADVVVVLDGGRIVQLGTHDELLQQSGYYRQISRSQVQA